MKGTEAACINHPTIHATIRCKQCSRPVCDSCVVQGPLGRYCSTVCKEKHQHFHQQVQTMDTRARGASFAKVKSMISTFLVLVAVLVVVGVFATLVEVPILSNLTYRVREALGF